MENTNVRTVVLTKKDMIALLGVRTTDEVSLICRVDPREEKPAVQVYDDPESALRWFRKSLKTSKNNGWEVVYDGLPLRG